MQLIWYLFILLLTFGFALTENVKLNPKLFFYFWMIVSIVMSIIVRMPEFYGDIEAMTYITMRELLPGESDFFQGMTGSIYYREPIVWYSLRFIYILFGSEFLPFLILDSITFIFLFKAVSLQKYVLKNTIDFKYIYFAVLLFFPFVIGFHAVYRQYVATIFILCAMGYAGKNNLLISFIFFLLSVLSHNAAVLFLPLLLYLSNSRIYKILAFATMPLIPIFFYFRNYIQELSGLSSKVEHSIGTSIGWLYTGVFGFLLIFVLCLNLVRLGRNDRIFVFILSFFVWLSSSAAFILNTAASERLGFLMFGLMYPLFLIYLDYRLSNKLLIRVLGIIITILIPISYYTKPFFISR